MKTISKDIKYCTDCPYLVDDYRLSECAYCDKACQEFTDEDWTDDESKILIPKWCPL
jgi:hypothetical protein